jgi:hypothetical protein
MLHGVLTELGLNLHHPCEGSRVSRHALSIVQHPTARFWVWRRCCLLLNLPEATLVRMRLFAAAAGVTRTSSWLLLLVVLLCWVHFTSSSIHRPSCEGHPNTSCGAQCTQQASCSATTQKIMLRCALGEKLPTQL